MHIEKMKNWYRVQAPYSTLDMDIATFNFLQSPEVSGWFAKNQINDVELIADYNEPFTSAWSHYFYYFANPEEAVLFSLRWS